MAEQSAVLSTHIEPDTALAPASSPTTTYKYYHAGPLFSLGELTANVRLSSAINQLSKDKYHPVLPQDLEQRDTSPHSIRDHDIQTLLSCDMALFTYDGSELDSGTVVEYMIAKFADIPSVILRTDFRGGGDQGSSNGDPWNLMSSFWPRTIGVVVDGMIEYKTGLAKGLAVHGDGKPSEAGHYASEYLLELTASKVVNAFDEVLRKPSRLPKELRPSVYQWLALMPAFKNSNDAEHMAEMSKLLQRKEEKQLYQDGTAAP